LAKLLYTKKKKKKTFIYKWSSSQVGWFDEPDLLGITPTVDSMYTQLAGGVDREMDWWKVLVFIRGGGV